MRRAKRRINLRESQNSTRTIVFFLRETGILSPKFKNYGYRFLRLNKFNLRPGQNGETKKDVLDRFLNNAFAVE